MINIICSKCKNNKVEIMSVREKKIKQEDKEISTVDITYICPGCGSIKTVNEFLYKDKKGKTPEEIIKEYAEDIYEEFNQVNICTGKIDMQDVIDILQIENK